MTDVVALRDRFRSAHEQGLLLLPNAWDVGSARVLEQLGAEALATTSSGFAASLGRGDQSVGVDELVAHVAALTAAVDVPVSVDAEHGYADEPAGVAETVEKLARAGAAGVSIEDYDPVSRTVYPAAMATERLAAAAEVAGRHGLLLTGRAENHLYDAGALDDTVARLIAYRDAGAGCVYAPGLTEEDALARVVAETGTAVNVLLLRGGPTVPRLSELGVRRVSTGGGLAWVGYGALVGAMAELQGAGTDRYLDGTLAPELRAAAFR